jgi:FixJ family two-component response regulator
MAVEAMRSGALDYLRKPVNEQQLLQKVAEAFATDQANSKQQLQTLAHQTQLNSLTNREQQVAALVVDGLANKVIASDLGISERTVEVHRASVMVKLEVKTLPQLVKSYLKITQ